MIDKTRGSTTVAVDDIDAKGVGNLTTISNNPSACNFNLMIAMSTAVKS